MSLSTLDSLAGESLQHNAKLLDTGFQIPPHHHDFTFTNAFLLKIGLVHELNNDNYHPHGIMMSTPLPTEVIYIRSIVGDILYNLKNPFIHFHRLNKCQIRDLKNDVFIFTSLGRSSANSDRLQRLILIHAKLAKIFEN